MTETAKVRWARGIAAAALLGLTALVVVRCRQGEPSKPAEPTAKPAASVAQTGRPKAQRPPPPVTSSPLPPSAPPAPSFDPAATRAERAKALLASYLDWAKYPPTSRPARERPDRQRPHAAATRKLPLSVDKADRTDDKASSGISLVLSQSHYYLTAEETVTLAVSCRRGEERVPCSVTGAVAEVSDGATGKAPAPSPVTFADDGRGGDVAAGDYVWTTAWTPKTAGFAEVTGPVSILASIEAGPERGLADFQVVSTGRPPAVFNGSVRETVKDGSLLFCLGIDVAEPGRYVLDGRVDDSTKTTFAFVSFNDVLPKGKQEVCLTVFGRLIADEGAKSPFVLRDVEGFLLLEDVFPDRRTMPTWEGAVHTTKVYKASDFSNAEWQSPVKERYVERLQKDAEAVED